MAVLSSVGVVQKGAIRLPEYLAVPDHATVSVVVPDAVLFDLIFLGRAYRGRYSVTDDEWEIPGRDVRNHASILFDNRPQR